MDSTSPPLSGSSLTTVTVSACLRTQRGAVVLHHRKPSLAFRRGTGCSQRRADVGSDVQIDHKLWSKRVAPTGHLGRRSCHMGCTRKAGGKARLPSAFVFSVLPNVECTMSTVMSMVMSMIQNEILPKKEIRCTADIALLWLSALSEHL